MQLSNLLLLLLFSPSHATYSHSHAAPPSGAREEGASFVSLVLRKHAKSLQQRAGRQLGNVFFKVQRSEETMTLLFPNSSCIQHDEWKKTLFYCFPCSLGNSTVYSMFHEQPYRHGGGGRRGEATPLLKTKDRVHPPTHPCRARILYNPPPPGLEIFLGDFLKNQPKIAPNRLKSRKIFLDLKFPFLPPPLSPFRSPPGAKICYPLPDRFLPPSCLQPPCPSMGKTKSTFLQVR